MKNTIVFSLAMLLMLAACGHASSDKREDKNRETSAGQVATVKRNVIRKHVNIPYEFSYLTNMGSVDIVYTQGDYRIDVEGDSAMLEYLLTEFDSNLLTVSIRSDGNPDINKYGLTSHVRMFISCPELKCVSVCGNGGFESRGLWRTDELLLGAMGTGAFDLEQVECNTFNIQSSDVGSIKIAELRAGDATIYSRSSAEIDVNMDVENLIVLNDGTQTLHLTGKARNVTIKRPKDERLINELE